MKTHCPALPISPARQCHRFWCSLLSPPSQSLHLFHPSPRSLSNPPTLSPNPFISPFPITPSVQSAPPSQSIHPFLPFLPILLLPVPLNPPPFLPPTSKCPTRAHLVSSKSRYLPCRICSRRYQVKPHCTFLKQNPSKPNTLDLSQTDKRYILEQHPAAKNGWLSSTRREWRV